MAPRGTISVLQYKIYLHYPLLCFWSKQWIWNNAQLRCNLLKLANKNQHLHSDASKFIVGKYNKDPKEVSKIFEDIVRNIRPKTKNYRFDWKPYISKLQKIQELPLLAVLRKQKMTIENRNTFILYRQQIQDDLEEMWIEELNKTYLYNFDCAKLEKHREDFVEEYRRTHV
ncbi:unnamed protein product [Caenorhabditis angaria]|uniref:Uncharacterized protein n=1 Tax=Caenorhabditis angaria TaxID=860376 RepID=A0A9P1MWW8_9PELO|nr:unnamed protein product [Caenorhabditis angaria]